MPHSEIIEQRLRHLQLDENAIQILQQVEGLFSESIDGMLDRFYDHIMQQPELASLFENKEAIGRARDAQQSHWKEILFASHFGEDEIERTRKIGVTHLKVNLDVSSYMIAYCFMLNEFIDMIAKKYEGDAEKHTATIQALNKAIMLDICFVLDAYFDAKNAAMKELLVRVNHFTEDIQELAEDLDGTVETLKAEPDAPAAADTISVQVANLRARLNDLQFGDRLYFEDKREASLLDRLRYLIHGRG